MPVLINLDDDDHHLCKRESYDFEGLSENRDAFADCVNIGLINNMPDSALMSTERQLFDLLSAASTNLMVRLHLFTIDTNPRAGWGHDYVQRFYRGIKVLLNSDLDGIIVTGAEPKTASLVEEPYWASFGQIIDWARENTLSSIYSCLAVHGAVLHLDGIEREPLSDKCIGVFSQTKATNHPLIVGVPSTFKIPHSRWNEVREASLAESGYTILAKSPRVGVDCFVKQHKRSLFIYFQGHPEYDARTLLGEYRRDIGRFLRGEIDNYPAMPENYFSVNAERTLMSFRREALSSRSLELFASFPTDQLAKDLNNTWHPEAARMYRNWFLYLSSRKAQEARSLAVGNFV